ncbi:MAG: site-specific DNA-methyltransferase [Pyrinomonadaceae bacterium MAG19_C2-C3]|nr:site-specific DNA-methyltransferase [Pyrinomonadaceae bacterium MAG19_C2-C3]
MKPQPAISTTQRFTFKGNRKDTRYGWLRLTPAYSMHLVSELLDEHVQQGDNVLDPFCGTGTTALACAERGINCDTIDINPFLIWLTNAKTHSYTKSEIAAFKAASMHVAKAIRDEEQQTRWLPPLYQIEKWWEESVLLALGRAMHRIKKLEATTYSNAVDLLKIAFCRLAIEQANVSFGHQSMSFKKAEEPQTFDFRFSQIDSMAAHWEGSIASIAVAATSLTLVQPEVSLCDARSLTSNLDANFYSCVITSPPYPNRMSYIRELRPYMYWLGYLQTQREAGELDWQAIGGTWGCATSNVGKWQLPSDTDIPYRGFNEILAGVAERSPLLSRYIHKYFYDMVQHCREIFAVVKPGGAVNYIIGNSKFYDVMLPAQEIYAAMFESCGFEQTEIRTIRKRTSKKELFEFVVSARKPSSMAKKKAVMP